MDYELLKFGTSALYDYQKTRIGLVNRMRNLIRVRFLGLEPFKVEDKKEEDEKAHGEYDDKSVKELKGIAKKLGKLSEEEEGIINQLEELSISSEMMEEKYKKWVEEQVIYEPIWTEWLSKVKGIGKLLTANLLYYYGYCENFDTVSKLWAYSGWHTVDGKAPKRKHGEQMNWNIKAKTLGFKIGDSFIKQRSIYRKIYDEAKTEYMKREDLREESKCTKCAGTGKTKGEDCKNCKGRGFTIMHMHRMAMRKMIKIFLEHYWMTARKLKGLPISDPYIIGKDGGDAPKIKHKHTHYIKPMTDEKI